MMRMTYASFKQFYENVDMKMIRSIWSPWRNKTEAHERRKSERSKQHGKQPSHKHGVMQKQV